MAYKGALMVDDDEMFSSFQRCAELGVAFGVGLSPFEIYRDFDAAAQEALARKPEGEDALLGGSTASRFRTQRGEAPS